MIRYRNICALRILLAVLVLGFLDTGRGIAHDDPEETVRLRAAPTDAEITVDGRLSEPAWRTAPVGSDFRQREPDPLARATEKTEIRVLYSDDTLYVGMEARDSEPGAIVARELGRDVPLFRDDSVILLLDTFHDHRNAYFFETNPLGSRTDALITDEGRDMNLEWDGVWTVGSRRTEEGWTAEFAIPFATLRFDPTEEIWGLNVRRLVRRKEEAAFWSPIDLDADLLRISRAGHLVGVEPPPRTLGLDVKPFATVTSRDGSEAADRREDQAVEFGLDLKWTVTRGLSLDATFNTDFAETEVDEQRVNLTRFSLFFPEKREFFLENAGIFEFGPSLIAGDSPLFKPFFSRRIGISEDGRRVPMEWGLRLAGRAGAWNLGVLGARTDAIGAGENAVARTDWGVMRFQRNLGRRSNVGLIATHRTSSEGRNTLAGVDADFRFTERWRIWTFGAGSDDSDPRSRGRGWAGGVGANWTAANWNWGGSVIEVDEDLEPGVGFLRRRGYRRYSSGFGWRPRPDDSGSIRNWDFGAGGTIFVDPETGRTETIATGANIFGLRFASGEFVTAFVQHRFERLEEGFSLHPEVFLPAGPYRWNEYGIFFESSDRREVSGRARFLGGEFFDGERRTTELVLAWRPSPRFRSETTWNRDEVELEPGLFAADVVRQRL
ncbi:MAG: DUF5916 domain-containing protein, partial [Thermoanaerobaculia bacterium]|nr:DUF5916 domain-containing protein [Thermoanaerobaculia bacterium]